MKVVVLNIYQYLKGKQKQKIHKSSFAEYILTITLYVIKFYLSCISVPLCLLAQEATIMSLLYHFISFHLIFRMEIYNKIFNWMEFHYDTGILSQQYSCLWSEWYFLYCIIYRWNSINFGAVNYPDLNNFCEICVKVNILSVAQNLEFFKRWFFFRCLEN